MHLLDFLLYLNTLGWVVAENSTWNPPANFLPKRQVTTIPPEFGGGRFNPDQPFDFGIVDVSTSKSSRTVINERPPPSVTTSFGTLNITSILSSANLTKVSSLESAWQCEQTLYNWTASGDRRAISTWIYTHIGLDAVRYSTGVANERLYTGCDGIPRVTWIGGTAKPNNSTMIAVPDPGTVRSVIRYDNSNPPCSRNEDFVAGHCDEMRAIWNEYDRLWVSGSRRGTIYTDLVKMNPNSGVCGYRGQDRNPHVTFCTLMVSEAELLYWPDPAYETVSLCQEEITTDANKVESTSTIEINGTTYISPSVYVKYMGITYRRTQGGYIDDSTLPDMVFPFRKTDVSSVCQVSSKTLPYNFRDLYGDVPWTAWACARGCASIVTTPNTRLTKGTSATEQDGWCRSIDTWRYPYNPILAWPSTFLDVLRSINTENPEDCDFGFIGGGIFDPPHILSKAPSLTEPAPVPSPHTTSRVAITQEAPAPSSRPNSPATQTRQNGPWSPIETGNGGGSQDPQSPGTDSPGRPGPQPGIGSEIISMINQPPGQPNPHNPQAGPHGNPPPPGLGGDPARPNPPGGGHYTQGLGDFIESMLGLPPLRPPPIRFPQAVVTLEASDPVTVVQVAGGMHVVAGTTYRAGDTMALPHGHIMSFGAGGVNIDGISSVGFFVPSNAGTDPSGGPGVDSQAVTVGGVFIPWGSSRVVSGAGGVLVSYGPNGITIGGESFAPPTEGSGVGLITLRDGTVLTVSAAMLPAQSLPPAILVSGQMIPLYGVATLSGGLTMSYGADGLVIGTKTFALPSGTQSGYITMSDGRVLKLDRMTAVPTGQMLASLIGAAASAARTTSPNRVAYTAGGDEPSRRPSTTFEQPARTEDASRSASSESAAGGTGRTIVVTGFVVGAGLIVLLSAV